VLPGVKIHSWVQSRKSACWCCKGEHVLVMQGGACAGDAWHSRELCSAD